MSDTPSKPGIVRVIVGLALIAISIGCFASIHAVSHDHDPGPVSALDGIDNVVYIALGLVFVIAGLICLISGALARPKLKVPQPEPSGKASDPRGTDHA